MAGSNKSVQTSGKSKLLILVFLLEEIEEIFLDKRTDSHTFRETGATRL